MGTQIKCQGTAYNYEYDVVRCEPKKSTVKCGAVLLAFPEADKNGIIPSCTSTKCYLSKPGVAKLEPSMVKCAGSRWRLGTNEVINDPKTMTFQMVTFNDFELDIDCKGSSFWDSVQDYYQPHALKKNTRELQTFNNHVFLNNEAARSGVHGTVLRRT